MSGRLRSWAPTPAQSPATEAMAAMAVGESHAASAVSEKQGLKIHRSFRSETCSARGVRKIILSIVWGLGFRRLEVSENLCRGRFRNKDQGALQAYRQVYHAQGRFQQRSS